jgi:epoxyqueuosine reductase QueG
VQSIIVTGYRESHGALESENKRISMASRMGGMEFSLKNNYLLTRFIEKETGTRAAAVPVSYPLDMDPPAMGSVADLSLRHAAVAAGLGVFGRHNLVIHPTYGSRIIFTAVLSELPFESDKPVTDELCDQCGRCVELCPAGALDEEGKTDFMKCLKNSQPYGIGGAIRYIRKFIGGTFEEQKALLKDPTFLNLYQSHFIGFHYFCFTCVTVCPSCIE